MSQSNISQVIKNLSLDPSLDHPIHFSKTELCAAVMSHHFEKYGIFPDRHQYQTALPIYLKSLPSDKLESAVIIATAAAKLLGMPGLKSDAERLQHARDMISQAEADAAEIEANRGRRLSRIHSLEQILKDLTNQRDSWQVDFASRIAEADDLIIEHFGKGYGLNGPFETLETMPILKRLAPRALKQIDAKLADAQAELDQLKN